MRETAADGDEMKQRLEDAAGPARVSASNVNEHDTTAAAMELEALGDRDEEQQDEGGDSAADSEEEEEESCGQPLLDLIDSMTVPAQRHAQVEWRRQLLQELLPAIRDSLPQTEHLLLDANVCELVADYLDDARRYRMTFRPHAIGPEDGQSFPTTVSKFGGYPYLLPHEEWPRCSESERALTFMLQLRVADFPAVLRPSLTLAYATDSTLFQCFYCKEHDRKCADTDCHRPDRVLRWLQPTARALERCPTRSAASVPAGGCATDWHTGDRLVGCGEWKLTGWAEQLDGPDYSEVEQLFCSTQPEGTDVLQRWLAIARNFPHQGTVNDAKLSGYASWRGRSYDHECPVCQQRMQLLLSISGTRLYDGHGYLKEGSLIVHICPLHREMMDLHVDSWG